MIVTAKPCPPHPPHLALPAWLLTCRPAPEVTWADADSGFDSKTLSQRGIDPQLASLLLVAPRFTAGKHAVTLRVNGQNRGRLQARFDQQGARVSTARYWTPPTW